MGKFLVAFSAIAAMAYAEADPYFGYGYAGAYGLGYAHLGLKSAPCVNAANVPVPCAAGYHVIGKRDAEAKAEAEPYYGYGYSRLGYAGLGYRGLGYHGLHTYGKRDAEAEPYYAHGYAGLGHAVVATPAGLVHSSHVGLCTNYLGASVPCKKKREADADAEADAAVLYSGYGYPSYGYAGLGYAGLGYAHHGVVAAPAVVAAAPAVVAPVATVHNAVLGTAALPNPVHAVAHTGYGAVVHSSHIGVCTNYLGEQVSC